MKRLNPKSLLTLAVLAIALSGMQMAKAQYSYTVGTAPAGGNTVVGTSAGSPLPRIVSGQLPLSTTGGDYVTLTIGSLASNDSHGESIKFATPNDTLLNNGTIDPGTGGNSVDNEVGVSFLSADLLSYPDTVPTGTTITGETVINNGGIFGGANSFPGPDVVGTAVSFLATEAIQTVSITNNATGNISGGSGSGSGSGSGESAVAGVGVSLYSEDSYISGVTLLNAGNIAGGSGGGFANVVGDGVSIYAANGVYTVNITNTMTGSSTGGSDGFANSELGTVGDGIAIFDQNEAFAPEINGVTLNNSGSILGGSENDDGVSIGNGVSIWGGNGVFNVVFEIFEAANDWLGRHAESNILKSLERRDKRRSAGKGNTHFF